MNFLSCFSGIEAASVAWHPLGFRCVGVAEVEPFPCAVLACHYPDVPNLGDVLADDFLERVAVIAPDAVVGGPPCQDFSVAGLRAGIHGHRGNLTLRWVQIIHASHARVAITENVPGWLSANNGHAFGAFLAGLVGHDTALMPPKDCGGRWTNAGMVAGPRGRAAWRILDAQYFGLAQRRKRVFVVFGPRNGIDPAAVLFEPASLRWHPPPSRTKGQGTSAPVAGSLTCNGDAHSGFKDEHGLVANPLGSHKEGGWRGDLDNDTFVAERASALSKSNPYGDHESCEGLLVARSLNAHANRCDGESETFLIDTVPAMTTRTGTGTGTGRDGMDEYCVAHSLRADGFDASEDGTGRVTPIVPIQYAEQLGREKRQNGMGVGDDGDPMFTLERRQPHGFMSGSTVRRLTPRECERLQGFPDDYTLIPYRGKPAADGPRYRALGNSMAVPVMAWIGQRIEATNGQS